MLKRLYPIAHFLYENRYTKGVAPHVVNLFKPTSVIVDGQKLYIDKDDRVISAELILSGRWEKFESELFKKTIKPGDTVIDIGAHIGYYTLIAAKKVGPTGKVYAFEPLRKNFELLTKNVQANGFTNVVLVNKAVSNKTGKSKLFLSNEDNFGDQRIYHSAENRKTISIETITLDEFFKSRDKHVQVIKMDIQGSEVLALTGSASLMRYNPKLTLFTELWPKALKEAGNSAKEYLGLLKRHGFSLLEIDNQSEQVNAVTSDQLLTRYPQDSMVNADLLCIKKP